MNAKKLTFYSGSFVLVNQKDNTEKPIDLKTALRFRSCADEKAQKVFNRTLLKHYEAPSQLPPNFLDIHQKTGVLHILTRSRSYLAHAPGSGKSAEAIVASQMTKASGVTVIIVPPSLTYNWQREIHLTYERAGYTEWPSIAIVPESKFRERVDWGADYIIVPDSMLAKDWVYGRLERLKIKLLGVDEASRFKEVTSERTKALFGGIGKNQEYYGLVQTPKHTVLLDGSPMPNRPMELWAPVVALDPECIDCMDRHEFGLKYCGGRYNDEGYKAAWEYKGATNLTELHERLRRNLFDVVTEDKLGHPERVRKMLFMKDSRTHEMKSWEQKHLQTVNLSAIDESMSRGKLAEYRQQLGLTKVDWVAKYARERLEDENEHLIVFAWHREVCRAIANKLKSFKPVLVMGGVSNIEREKGFEAFQSGRRKLIVGNIGAMGRGHNLQRATRAIFAEFSWSDELNKQCEKRGPRKGSVVDYFPCDYVVVPNSLDEVTLNSVFTKQRNVKKVIG